MNSAIVSAMIASVCAGPDAENYQKACVAGTTAAIEQNGAAKNIERWEKIKGKKAEAATKQYLGTEKAETMATMLAVINSISGNMAFFRIEKGPLNGKYEVGTSSKNVKIDVKWDF